MARTIDLAHYNSSGIRVYAGRDRGEAVRAKAKLDEADDSPDTVEVKVPDDIFSITSSFFLGMFGKSIRKLGESEFRQRYRFTGPSIGEVVEDAIHEALRTSSPLLATGEHRTVR
ncbi:MAG: hypothetical protein ACREL5_12330 [Gemmatimonadales bacterium]